MRPRQSGDSATRIDFAPGTEMERYVLLEQIGSGGMGVVYCAVDRRLARKVALKFFSLVASSADQVETGASQSLQSQDPRKMLICEAKAAAAISHPNIAPIFDVGEFSGRVFLAMEYLPLGSLRSYLRAHLNLPLRQRIDWMLQAAAGLAAVHRSGMVHGDFKLDNLLIGEDMQVRLIDFGLAHAVTKRRRSDSSKTSRSGTSMSGVFMESTHDTLGTIVGGTPSHMAPELHDGQPADELSDQYAFCVALHEALTGERPFSGDRIGDLIAAKRNFAFQMRAKYRELPAWLREILRRGLSYEPQGRYRSLAELVDELRAGNEARPYRGFMLAVSACLALGIPVGMQQQLSQPDPCDVGAQQIADVWNPEVQSKIRQSFELTQVHFAQDAFERTQRLLNSAQDRWGQSYRFVCREAAAKPARRGEHDASYRCLQDNLRGFSELVSSLSGASAQTVEKAVDAARKLPDANVCKDSRGVDLVDRGSLTPEEAATENESAKFIARYRANLATGKLDEAVSQHRELEAILPSLKLRSNQIRAVEGLAEEARSGWQFHDAINYYTRAWLLSLAGTPGPESIRIEGALLYVKDYAGESLADQEDLHRHGAALLRSFDHDAALGVELLWSRGVHYIGRGLGSAAEEIYRTCIARFANSNELDHPRAPSAWMNLGLSLILQGKDEDGIAYNHRALEGLERVLGAFHPDLQFPLNNIGFALQNLERPAEALDYHLAARKLVEDVTGPNHPKAAPSYHYLSRTYQFLRRYDDAKASYDALLELFESVFGARHFRTVSVCVEAAAAAEQRGDWDEALRLAQLTKERANGTPLIFEAGSAELVVSRIYRARGDFDGALASMRRAAVVLPEKIDWAEEQGITFGELYNQLVTLLLETGQVERAGELIERVYGGPINKDIGSARRKIRDRLETIARSRLLFVAGDTQGAAARLQTLLVDYPLGTALDRAIPGSVLEAVVLAGDVALASGNAALAAARFEQALAVYRPDSDLPTTWYFLAVKLADAKRQLGDNAGAKRLLALCSKSEKQQSLPEDWLSRAAALRRLLDPSALAD